MTSRILNREELQSIAPSIFAVEPWQKMSDRYRFVPTIDVVNALQDTKIYPVYAQQSATRIEGKGNYTRHVIRFRREEDINRLLSVNEEILEYVLVNSHDGTTTYQLMLGIYRCVCQNQMTVLSGEIKAFTAKHIGERTLAEQIIDGTEHFGRKLPNLVNQIASWKSIELTPPQQLAYAESALSLRDSALALQSNQILQARRYSDMNQNSLWSTFNRVQENIIKGGNVGINTQNHRRRTRAIKSVSENLKINQALWMLTEKMAVLTKGGAQ